MRPHIPETRSKLDQFIIKRKLKTVGTMDSKGVQWIVNSLFCKIEMLRYWSTLLRRSPEAPIVQTNNNKRKSISFRPFYSNFTWRHSPNHKSSPRINKSTGSCDSHQPSCLNGRSWWMNINERMKTEQKVVGSINVVDFHDELIDHKPWFHPPKWDVKKVWKRWKSNLWIRLSQHQAWCWQLRWQLSP